MRLYKLIMRSKIFHFVFFAFLTQLVFSQRSTQIINDAWKFHKGEHSVNSINEQKSYWQDINLPHTWNNEDTLDEQIGFYKGVAWYLKELYVDKVDQDKQIYLYFEGANQETEVYVNGDLVGNHIGGYTAFSFDVTSYLKFDAANKIEVKVDNSPNKQIAPLSADFNFYGGIYRNVKLIKTDPIHFDMSNKASQGVFVNYSEVSENSAKLDFEGTIQNDSPTKESVTIKVEIFDQSKHKVTEVSKSIDINASSQLKVKLDEVIVSNPELWSPSSPYLYEAKISLSTNIKKETRLKDHINLPIGIKTSAFDEKGRFLLNGQPLKLIGSNRHQDIQGYGNALSDAQHYSDFKKIKDLGFNFVRLAHYPQAPEVYRACDELGLLVWSEIPVVNEITESDEFAKNSLNMQQEHIRQTYNHPSIIMYGYMNELFLLLQFSRAPIEQKIEKSKVIVSLAKELNKLTKEEAPDRFAVMAFHGSDLYNQWGLAEIPDVVGWNLYQGWYSDDIEDLSIFLKTEHEKYPNRKLIVSEYGPGADVRLHSNQPVAWDYSEDFQIDFHNSYLKQMMNLDFLSGFAVWNYADFGSEYRNDAIPFVNQKGLLNFDRSVKEVAYLYEAWFGSKPMAHIASRNYLIRSAIESNLNEGLSDETVRVISNVDRIVLSVNGKSFGEKNTIDYQAEFKVQLQEGKNVIEVFSDDQLLDRLELDNRIIYRDFKANDAIDIAVNVGSKASFFDSENNLLWIADQKYDQNVLGYTGGNDFITPGAPSKPGISKNILKTEKDPLYQTFNEGIESYYIKVPKGNYKLHLLFQEYQEDGSNAGIVYNLNLNDADKKPSMEKRIFDIYANNRLLKLNVNIQESHGSLTAADLDFELNVKGNKGLTIEFRAVQGKPILSAIRLKKID